MTARLNDQRYKGGSAAPGIAVGPCAWLTDGGIDIAHETGSTEEERALLDVAVAQSMRQLEALSEQNDELGADILEFQLALLDDEDLLALVHEGIASGASAPVSWRKVLTGEIEDYASADDEYMAARSADLTDLRDRVLRALAGGDHTDEIADGSIVVADDLTPSRFLSLDWTKLGGAVLMSGSTTSHVSILARSRGVPMMVDVAFDGAVETGDMIAMDAGRGEFVVRPNDQTLKEYSDRNTAEALLNERAASIQNEPAVTADGHPIRVLINVNQASDLDDLSPQICDGIGLTRTEFLFADGAPDEDLQYREYARIVRWADGRPVTIRTLDAGGDKPMPGITVDGETNPFLSVRGLRLSLIRRDLFKTQLRALVRAGAIGPLKIMVPMVSVPSELEETRALLSECVAELEREGAEFAVPELGMMVEVPAAALTAERFDAAFYSIGSNDLIQYTMAVARDVSGLSHLTGGDNEAVIELVRRTVEAGKKRGVEVSLCGDMASRPEYTETLIGAGLETFSVAPAGVARVKLAISQIGAANGAGA